MKILIVHGIGYKEGLKESDRVWQGEWIQIIQNSLNFHKTNIELGKDDNVFFSEYDGLFRNTKPVFKNYTSTILNWIRVSLAKAFNRSRSWEFININEILLKFFDPLESTLGMVVKWLENENLVRDNATGKILDDIKKHKPDIIFAHSLGSLICYHAFNTPEGKQLIKDKIFVGFGSQIGHSLIVSKIGGRIVPIQNAKHWYNLYNPRDIMFTESIENQGVYASNFKEYHLDFDIEFFKQNNTSDKIWENLADAFLDHEGKAYLSDEKVKDNVFGDILDRLGLKPKAKSFSVDTNDYPKKLVNTKQRKALLVGINEYPNPYNNLNGCVNDVFLMSQALQESGFKAENIRILLNNRATSKEIYNRLEWLTGDVRNEEERVFFYSGHGVQVPSYGYDEEVDHSIECLATYDFDYDNPDETGITDKKFREFYSNLNYNSNFTVILDCCHSGGMDRGVQGKIKGLEIPDDIRHRMQFWDAEKGWQKRIFPTYFEKGSKYFDFAGESGSCQKIGRALELRNPNEEQFKTQRDFFGHLGPYLPIIFEACQEHEPALEMKYGNQAYGAFTFSFVNTLHALRKTNIKPSLDSFLKLVGDNLRQYITGQTPRLVAPQDKRIETFRW